MPLFFNNFIFPKYFILTILPVLIWTYRWFKPYFIKSQSMWNDKYSELNSKKENLNFGFEIKLSISILWRLIFYFKPRIYFLEFLFQRYIGLLKEFWVIYYLNLRKYFTSSEKFSLFRIFRFLNAHLRMIQYCLSIQLNTILKIIK